MSSYRTLMLAALVLVGCVNLLRMCHYVMQANAGFGYEDGEVEDPDEICHKRCLGPWVSYQRDSSGQDHCRCVQTPSK